MNLPMVEEPESYGGDSVPTRFATVNIGDLFSAQPLPRPLKVMFMGAVSLFPSVLTGVVFIVVATAKGNGGLVGRLEPTTATPNQSAWV
jgi:hypothetical protein